MQQHDTDDARYCVMFRVAADHPCLPGHFPGHPLVPGVVVLEHVAKALRDWRNLRVAHVREVKFLAPLYPEECAELQLLERSGSVRFEVSREGQILARGMLEGAA